MESSEKVGTIFRVYRKNPVQTYMLEVCTNECIVVARHENEAKGIALAEYPSLIEGCTKKDIMVEPVKLTVGMVLLAM